ncbi:MAG: hypothetical protein WDO70_04590 [Alphaproteobacteria bacterium]
MLQALLKEKMSHVAGKARRVAASIETAAAPSSVEETAVTTSGGFFGGQVALDDFFIPGELVGGACPRVRGQEREIAWHAAAEACDSERLHMVWSATEDRVWYLAARSAEFASKPFTWCPFASLLPGMKDATPGMVCYAYYSDEAATMMTVSSDTLQIHRGTPAVVRAKTERVIRELGDAASIEIDPEMVMGLTPVAWYSVSLFEDRARRLLTLVSVAAAMLCLTVAFLVWLIASLSIVSHRSNLEAVQTRTQERTMQLMQSVEKLRASVMRDQIARFTELNEGLVQVGGWLKFYQIKSNAVRWRALLPVNVTGDRIKELGGKLLDTKEQGVLVGTDKLTPDGK